MNNLKVSACIITYNHEGYIRECLEGAIQQRVDFDYEIIIGEDKSTDATRQICAEYASRYPELIKFFPRENNMGMMGNWIQTMQECKGKYIAICEGDDYWTDPLKLQKQVDFMDQNEGVAICGTNFNVMQDGTLLEKNRFATLSVFTHYDIFDDNKVGTLTSLFRNNFTVPNYFRSCNFVDMALLLELTKDGGTIAILPFNAAVYRIHDGGVFSGASMVNNLKKGLMDVVSFMDHNPKNFKYIPVTLLQYSKKAIIQLTRALLRRPFSDIRFFTIYIKTLYRVLYRFTKA